MAHLWKLPGAKEKLQIVRADLLEEGSFDEAVMSCDGVFHTASPVLAKSDSSSKACCICFKQSSLSSVSNIMPHMHLNHPTSLSFRA